MNQIQSVTKRERRRVYHFHQVQTSQGSSLPAGPEWLPDQGLQTQALERYRQQQLQKPMLASSPPLLHPPSPLHVPLTRRAHCCTSQPPPPPPSPWRRETVWWGTGRRSSGRTAVLCCCSSLTQDVFVSSLWFFRSVCLSGSSWCGLVAILVSPRAISLAFICWEPGIPAR